MKCPYCGEYIEFPWRTCPSCRQRIKWKAKNITLEILWKIFTCVIAPIIIVGLFKECG